MLCCTLRYRTAAHRHLMERSRHNLTLGRRDTTTTVSADANGKSRAAEPAQSTRPSMFMIAFFAFAGPAAVIALLLGAVANTTQSRTVLTVAWLILGGPWFLLVHRIGFDVELWRLGLSMMFMPWRWHLGVIAVQPWLTPPVALILAKVGQNIGRQYRSLAPRRDLTRA